MPDRQAVAWVTWTSEQRRCAARHNERRSSRADAVSGGRRLRDAADIVLQACSCRQGLMQSFGDDA